MNAVDLHYETHGRDDAPAAVLVHALGADHRQWDAVIPRLADRLRVITVDLRGHGDSRPGPGREGPQVPDGPYAIADLGADVLAVLDRLGVESAAFAGVSIGGAVGQWLAATSPGRVDALALVCSAPRFGTGEQWRERAARVRAGGTAAIADTVVPAWFAPGYADAHPGALADALRTFRATTDEAYAACCDALADWDFAAELPGITAATLVIGGRDDRTATPPIVTDLAQAIPGARLEILDRCAHQAPLERSATLTALLARHLAGARARADDVREVPGNLHRRDAATHQATKEASDARP